MDGMRQSRKTPVVVAGAGIGGLAAATVLAAAGCPVTVLEREAAPGGKIRPGLRDDLDLDTGPTVLTMRFVFDALFGLAGQPPPGLQPLATLAQHRWRGGARLDLYPDAGRSAAAIAGFAGPADARRYRAFCRQAAGVYEALLESFMLAPRSGLPGMLRRMGLAEQLALARANPFRSLASAMRARFGDPRLAQLFSRYATYYGSSPFRAPATLMLIAHVERLGVWRLPGGLRALAAALAGAARRAGATIRCGETVSTIDTDRAGRVSAVTLASGERLAASQVVVNGDANAIAAGLFGEACRAAVASTPPAARSLSAFTFAGRAVAPAALDYHNVFFGDDYADEFTAVFERSEPPRRPTVYLCAPDRGATWQAGRPERLFLLINGPPQGDAPERLRTPRGLLVARVAEQLEACGLSLEGLDDFELTTPADFAARYPGTGGALYGRATHGWYAAFRRPGNRTGVRGLYVAGGSTHPGAGVPMAALSGMRAAQSLLADSGMRAELPVLAA